jgi:signal transduction histidine kinase
MRERRSTTNPPSLPQSAAAEGGNQRLMREMNEALVLSAVRQQELVEQLERSQERLRLADRMAAVGTLAAGLAHDMKNVLLPLSERVDAILNSPGLPDTAAEDITVVSALLDHLRAMAKNLSLFAMDPDKEGVQGETDLVQWCEQVHGLIDASAGAAVLIRWCMPAELPAVGVAPHRLTQAVMNLVYNARDAVAASHGAFAGGSVGRITVEARAEPARGGDVSCIILQVRDDGCGMTEEVKRRSIEPFFTTKDRPAAAGGGGTGLGLSLVHAIVKGAGGTMEIDSERGKGTTVILHLPLARPAAPGA